MFWSAGFFLFESFFCILGVLSGFPGIISKLQHLTQKKIFSVEISFQFLIKTLDTELDPEPNRNWIRIRNWISSDIKCWIRITSNQCGSMLIWIRILVSFSQKSQKVEFLHEKWVTCKNKNMPPKVSVPYKSRYKPIYFLLLDSDANPHSK